MEDENEEKAEGEEKVEREKEDGGAEEEELEKQKECAEQLNRHRLSLPPCLLLHRSLLSRIFGYGWTNGKNRRTDGRTDTRTERRMDRWTNALMDGRTNGRTDR